ncbi:plasmid mobilization protein [Mucilaginibacter boryungensis]|uniref:Plasmid mobilization relaxosome protein MobC n=1 Tax=Mucilaginibacter boryungensis TaxID=768480 RepID=A0ABR9XL14_9SPHI|nr:plasmid mobilization relaxosome protein MobC [Mucilaginibacter boryungensis]MBE9668097.1 plasmid mobilization relaxosome protein MobC [Mucilaginibacter boryungensis]
MMEQVNNKTKWLHLRLSPTEQAHINKAFKKTTCRKLSDYARSILMGKPVVSTYRDSSLDDFMTELMKLKNDLNACGNNFNQAVRKLNSLDKIEDKKRWFSYYDSSRQILQDCIQQVDNYLSKMADQWLQ